MLANGVSVELESAMDLDRSINYPTSMRQRSVSHRHLRFEVLFTIDLVRSMKDRQLGLIDSWCCRRSSIECRYRGDPAKRFSERSTIMSNVSA